MTSLREFVEVLASYGSLVRVNQTCDLQFQLGQITRDSKTPLLFENVKGYPGRRVFTNGLRNIGSFGLALGMEAAASLEDLVAEMRARVSNPVAPNIVEAGPVLENVRETGALDLFSLPVPQWHTSDCGRYLGTWHINVTKDPETGIRNVGVYRMQLLDSHRATVSSYSDSHLARHVASAEKLGHALPMAIAIGVSETVMMAASAGCPYGTDEYELAGALQRSAIDLIRCRTVDLEVPANSEIVIEGSIRPDVRVQDGPYFDYTGNTSTNPRAFLFEANRLMFRNDFIFRGSSIGIPGGEDHQLFAVLADLKLLDFHGSAVKRRVQDLFLRERLHKWVTTESW